MAASRAFRWNLIFHQRCLELRAIEAESSPRGVIAASVAAVDYADGGTVVLQRA